MKVSYLLAHLGLALLAHLGLALLEHLGLARTFAPKWGRESKQHTYQDFFAI